MSALNPLKGPLRTRVSPSMRSEETLDRLTQALTSNCGDWLAAARTTGVSLQFVQQWMKDDELTRTTLQEAAAVGAQGLVSAAIQRAVHGVDEDVYYKGMVVGSKTNYSDTLLTTLLKARVEEFRTPDAATPQVTVNIANLMPRATSYEEWLGMKGSTLAVSAANRQGTTDEPLTVEYHDTFKGLDL